MVVRAQNGCKCISYLTSWLQGRLGAATCCTSPASWGKIVGYITSLEKDPNSKFKVNFLLNSHGFHTIVKSKKSHVEFYISKVSWTCMQCHQISFVFSWSAVFPSLKLFIAVISSSLTLQTFNSTLIQPCMFLTTSTTRRSPNLLLHRENWEYCVGTPSTTY